MLPGVVTAVAAVAVINGGNRRTQAEAGARAVRRRRSGECGVSKRDNPGAFRSDAHLGDLIGSIGVSVNTTGFVLSGTLARVTRAQCSLSLPAGGLSWFVCTPGMPSWQATACAASSVAPTARCRVPGQSATKAGRCSPTEAPPPLELLREVRLAGHHAQSKITIDGEVMRGSAAMVGAATMV